MLSLTASYERRLTVAGHDAGRLNGYGLNAGERMAAKAGSQDWQTDDG
ncbi:hypothetical protein [Fimbriiglobus ruber]|nr:hypothetical protein [Fimbriiglobus ruber]